MIPRRKLKAIEGRTIKKVQYNADNHIEIFLDNDQIVIIWAETFSQYNIPILDINVTKEFEEEDV